MKKSAKDPSASSGQVGKRIPAKPAKSWRTINLLRSPMLLLAVLFLTVGIVTMKGYFDLRQRAEMTPTPTPYSIEQITPTPSMNPMKNATINYEYTPPGTGELTINQFIKDLFNQILSLFNFNK